MYGRFRVLPRKYVNLIEAKKGQNAHWEWFLGDLHRKATRNLLENFM